MDRSPFFCYALAASACTNFFWNKHSRKNNNNKKNIYIYTHVHKYFLWFAKRPEILKMVKCDVEKMLGEKKKKKQWETDFQEIKTVATLPLVC